MLEDNFCVQTVVVKKVQIIKNCGIYAYKGEDEKEEFSLIDRSEAVKITFPQDRSITFYPEVLAKDMVRLNSLTRILGIHNILSLQNRKVNLALVISESSKPIIAGIGSTVDERYVPVTSKRFIQNIFKLDELKQLYKEHSQSW